MSEIIPKIVNSKPCNGKIVIREEKPKNESIDASNPIPQLAQDNPNIEINIDKVCQKPLFLFIFLLSFNKININKNKSDIEKINKIVINNIKGFFNSLISKNEIKNNFIFSDIEKKSKEKIFKELIKFLNTKYKNENDNIKNIK